ncbi:MAG: helix-hairpin-helix domain-containing protein [Bacteroidales bacterium]|nr:helix-hairpin-helix domain-containing protein [Bacteroidales bacterium]
MKRRIVRYLFFLCSSLMSLSAQTVSSSHALPSSSELISRVVSYMLEEAEEEEIDVDDITTQLTRLLDAPIDLNTATPSDLSRLCFLTPLQIENLYYYIQEFGPINVYSELQLVDGIDDYVTQLLLHFVVINPSTAKKKFSLHESLASSKSNFTMRLHSGIETKRGYGNLLPDEKVENGMYLGSRLYHSLSYKLTSSNLQLGLTAEKDPGEPYFSRFNRGFDSYSAHLRINRLGRFSTILVGDYRASFGQGLVLNQSYFYYSNNADVFNVMKSASGITAKSSNDEYNFFRGAATTVRLVPHLYLTALYSYRKMDADTVGGSFTRLLPTGLHRTEQESAYRHTLGMHTTAANLNYSTARWHIGATFYFNHTSLPLIPDENVYNLMSFEGKTQLAGSVDYMVRLRSLKLFGEWALNQSQALATINGVVFSPSERASFLLAHRYYAPRYDLFFSNAFSRLSTSNEHGVYLATKLEPLPLTWLSAYVDVYTHPWMRYHVYAPTKGSRAMVKIEVKPSDQFSAMLRWRMRSDQRSLSIDYVTGRLHEIEDLVVNTLRLQTDYSFGYFTGRTLLEASHSKSVSHGVSSGFVVSQDVGMRFAGPKIRFKAHYVYFNTPDYDCRSYLYEEDILGLYQTPLLYGQGHRYALVFHWQSTIRLNIALKWSQTFYTDQRSIIGIGLEQIDGRRTSDVRLLLSYRFDNHRKKQK